MLHLQHNVISKLYSIKGLVEAHLSRVEENRFSSVGCSALEHAQHSLKRIYAQAENAIQITKSISLAMKSQEETMSTDSDCTIECAWEKAIKVIKAQYPFGSIDVINHIVADFPKISCLEQDLTEVFCLLGQNACQAMQGSGKLIVRSNLQLDASEQPTAVITFADTGPGIPSETLANIFTPFFTTKSNREGSGLGLCIAKGLVVKNRGCISVSSFQGQGTSISIQFNLANTARNQHSPIKKAG